MDEPTYDRMFATNVKGALFAVRAATPLLRRGGAVVLCGSINGHIGMAGSAAYAASKGAIHAFARVAATELAPRGVRVNVVSPGPTDSGIIEKMGMSRTQTDAVKSHLAEQIAMKRLGTVDEIARAALFLVSDDSAFMTGQELLIDGGLTLGAAST
jgi:NAD(P)-dependent dehydrogenase (short-subunit alcohol dehydrogenase family)